MSRFSQWVREHIGSPRADATGPAHGRAGGDVVAPGQAGDRASLPARARRLVEAATARASESYPQIAQVHPALAAVKRDRWVLCATAAGACMGLQMMVRRPEILESFEPLQDLVHTALAAQHRDAPALYDQCRLHLARTANTHSTFTGQNVIGDRIGGWLLTTLFERPPTVHEQAVARTIGRTVDIPLQAWWD